MFLVAPVGSIDKTEHTERKEAVPWEERQQMRLAFYLTGTSP